MTRRVRIGILIAIVGIGLAAVGFYTLNRIIRQTLAPLPAATPPPPITAKAVVVTHDLPLGSVVRSGDVKTVDVPVELAPPGVISDVESVIGRIIKVRLVTGEMVMDHNLANPTNVNSDLGFVIGDNQVLMAFPAGDLMSSLSIPQRGDLIDFFVTYEMAVAVGRESGGEVVASESETVSDQFTFNAMQRTEITAMVVDIVQEEQRQAAPIPGVEGQEQPQAQPTPSPSQVTIRAYLLALSPQDALLLKHLKDTGAIFDLVLRSPTSTTLFELPAINRDYLLDRYGFVILK